MYYEVNVSKNGRHLFATAERSVIHRGDLLDLVSLFNRKFPVTEGYEITVSECAKTSRTLETGQLLAESMHSKAEFESGIRRKIRRR